MQQTHYGAYKKAVVLLSLFVGGLIWFLIILSISTLINMYSRSNNVPKIKKKKEDFAEEGFVLLNTLRAY